jgi:phage baseplate assembly protein W
MGSIRIQSLEKISPRATKDDLSPRTALTDDYTYRDVEFDLKLDKLGNISPDDKTVNNIDIADLRDLMAIKQSVVNIFNTRPGQKILNPNLGMDLTHFLFDPITEQTADLLARSILKGLAIQEPRIRVTNLEVIGDIEANRYNIAFVLQLPNLNTNKVTFNGILTTDGFGA